MAYSKNEGKYQESWESMVQQVMDESADESADESVAIALVASMHYVYDKMVYGNLDHENIHMDIKLVKKYLLALFGCSDTVLNDAIREMELWEDAKEEGVSAYDILIDRVMLAILENRNDILVRPFADNLMDDDDDDDD